ncbi:Porphobilinogen synthase [Ruminiclostridium papyrosolvens DSM 2782]|uniref:Delta-aminolevulinic acid dehydratase n=1 Tax=Ruminiclostridium papyrosolvens DSM 2782 TaxID=588581 RepID=F1T8W6_9FIRM|nr:porphobilinogen synthase [Ruminiclostridium papyrosolvens]EGD48948.1 Porphobilinogen synthase [Ruminiclostridium papyrosolvens DSM 2782]WES35432.1 porphobilinogen synthase [Ruminiclostridium papyrosolvens DSM 2782]
MINRPRRLRTGEVLRKAVRETRLSTDSLIQPLFIIEGNNIKKEISSLPGQYHYSPDMVGEGVENALKAGVKSVLLFGLPEHKDEKGTEAYNENGVLQQGIREIKQRYPQMQVITDICMCEYTSHGHCGILEGEKVDNDRTLPYLEKIALSHARAGADIVAPSDMMDGRINALRTALDKNGFTDIPVMSYAVKYASSFYGPFREAAGSTPAFGDRKSYQMDYHNRREAVKEALLDVEEGADILMVKPALAYLDVIKEVREKTKLPLAAYSVSGEYAMIKAAASQGLIDEYGVMCESAVSIFRAGADILITYFAKEISEAIKKGDIG